VGQVGGVFTIDGHVCQDLSLILSKIEKGMTTNSGFIAHEGQWITLWRLYFDSSIKEAVYHAQQHLEAFSEDVEAPWWSEAAKGEVVRCPKQLGKLFSERLSYRSHTIEERPTYGLHVRIGLSERLQFTHTIVAAKFSPLKKSTSSPSVLELLVPTTP